MSVRLPPHSQTHAVCVCVGDGQRRRGGGGGLGHVVFVWARDNGSDSNAEQDCGVLK